MELRDYQEKAITSLRDTIRQGSKNPIMALPCGSGKSMIFGQVIANALEKEKTVLWLVHRRNLVYQMQEVLEEHFNIHPGIIMAGIESETENSVQLCTIQTYHRRLKLDPLDLNRFFVDADLILIDEGHRSLSKTYMDIIKLYEDKIVMSCTATPMRADGRGMSEVYDAIIDVAGVKELTDQGYLSPARYFVPYEPELHDVKVAMGDYVVKELDEKMNTPKLAGDVVENWLKHAEARKTIVFAVNVKHSIALKDEFIRAGVQAEHLDAKSPDDDRQAVFDAMERGDITVICNVALYQEGLDVPDVSCIVMARPTKSLGLMRQCLGRGLRIFEGKKDCLIFDHGGVLKENGFLEDEIEWSLDGKERAFIRKAVPKEKKPVVCRACHFVFEGSRICPQCGSPVRSFGKTVETREAEMRELKAEKNKPPTMAEKRRFYGMLEYERRMRHYQEGWTAHKFKAKFSVFPKGLKGTAPIQPNAQFFNWLKYQNIRYWKAKEKEAKAA